MANESRPLTEVERLEQERARAQMERDKAAARQAEAIPEEARQRMQAAAAEKMKAAQLALAAAELARREEALRDFFAGQALQGLASVGHLAHAGAPEVARLSYEAADAMMRARATKAKP